MGKKSRRIPKKEMPQEKPRVEEKPAPPPKPEVAEEAAKSRLDQLFWARAALGVLAGLLAGLLGFLSSSPIAHMGLFFPMLLYFASYILGKYVIKVEASGKGIKLLTTGLGSFIMLFLFTWILYNTLFRPP